MGAIASQITSPTFIYSTVYSDADQRKHQSSASLAFVRGIHRGSVNSPHKWPVTRKMLPFDDIIMKIRLPTTCRNVALSCATCLLSLKIWNRRSRVLNITIDLAATQFARAITLFSDVKPASNDFGCICEQIWKEQCSMEVYITINRTKWCCSKLSIKLDITTKNFFTFVMPLRWAAVIGYM